MVIQFPAPLMERLQYAVARGRLGQPLTGGDNHRGLRTAVPAWTRDLASTLAARVRPSGENANTAEANGIAFVFSYAGQSIFFGADAHGSGAAA